jgi:hypothetical protein
MRLMKPYRDGTANADKVLPNMLQIAERTLMLPTGGTLSAYDIKTVTSLLVFLSKTTA